MLTFTVMVKLIGQPMTSYPYLQVAQLDDLMANLETSRIEEIKIIREGYLIANSVQKEQK